jgi:organic radical activating enzyme
MIDKRIFPIHNKSACVYKWTWNTIGLFTGVTASCHRTEHTYLTPENFKNFHNNDKVIASRKLMLDGIWPDAHVGCDYCQKLEEVGAMSDRTYHNPIPGLTPVDFDVDQLNVTPRILEIYLNNTCDLRCMYCMPDLSSRINSELKQYGPLPTKNTRYSLQYVEKSPHQQQFLDLTLDWLEENYSKILTLSVLGGEPFFQQEFNVMMDFVKTHANPELTLSVNTNLNSDISVITNYVKTVKQLIIDKKIKRATINCSLDCFGPEQEFIRNGLNLNRWRENFEYIIQHKWLYITVQHAVTSLSIGTMSDLQKYINQKRVEVNPKINQTFQLVDEPQGPVLTPEIFGKDYFSADLDAILLLIPQTTDQEVRAYKRMETIVKLIKSSEVNRPALGDLKITMEEMDRRRNTNWRSVFPWLDNYFIRNEI